MTVIIISAYILTILSIWLSLQGLISTPIVIPLRLIKLPFPLASFLGNLIAWWVVDYLWVFAGAGVLPIILLIFASLWYPLYLHIKQKTGSGLQITKEGRVVGYAQGFSALTYFILKLFVDDPIRWI